MVRNSAEPGITLTIASEEWLKFLVGIKDGSYD
jgi:hypothetical protein